MKQQYIEDIGFIVFVLVIMIPIYILIILLNKNNTIAEDASIIGAFEQFGFIILPVTILWAYIVTKTFSKFKLFGFSKDDFNW